MSKVEHILPDEIEKASFAIIEKELNERKIIIPSEFSRIIKRVIHTTADFDFASTLKFSEGVLKIIQSAIQEGASIVTDTNMVLAGINKKSLMRFGGKVYCFMADEDVVLRAKEEQITRAAASMKKACVLQENLIFSIGNAPTALIELCSLIESGFKPVAVIGVPVGFVNVISAKEMIMKTGVPFIVNEGRKGGSAVAAAIINAILYSIN